MAKKLLINCGTCDARNTKEETLAAYDSITINCGDLLVSPETQGLLNRYGVAMNCGDVLELEQDVKMASINGSSQITGATQIPDKTFLNVNGSLTITPDAGEVLKSYVGLTVNGSVLCPESLSGYLAKASINGSVNFYPDEAILLKKNAVIDRLFALRAKERLYWAAKRLIMVDEQLDPAVLERKGVRFASREAIMAESKVEGLIGLIDEKTDITIVPDGTSVIFDDVDLDEVTVKKYGTKLYIVGDIQAKNAAALERLEYLNVQGDAAVEEDLRSALMEAITVIDGDITLIKHPRGRQFVGNMSLRISKWMLEQEPDGIRAYGCLNVLLDEDIPSQLILEKLTLDSCLEVRCTPEQEAAVYAVSQDVMNIGQGYLDQGVGKTDLSDTKIINAGDYVL